MEMSQTRDCKQREVTRALDTYARPRSCQENQGLQWPVLTQILFESHMHLVDFIPS